MAIKVIAQRREVKLGKNPGKKFVMRPDLYIPIVEKKVFQAAWDAAGEVIRTWATEGHSVPLPGLGTMRFGVRSKAVEDLEDVKASLITVRRIIFTPNVDLKDELKNTSIQITCLDEDGNVLKRVTSGDSGSIEDNDNDDSTDSGSGEGSGSGSGEGSGSGSGSGSGDDDDDERRDEQDSREVEVLDERGLRGRSPDGVRGKLRHAEDEGDDMEGSGYTGQEAAYEDKSRHHERDRSVAPPVVGREEAEEEGGDDREAEDRARGLQCYCSIRNEGESDGDGVGRKEAISM